jgi:small subunit ribosomal protein S4
LKGSRCLTSKCSIERRGYAPGQHGPNMRTRRQKSSDYSHQLREKQKMRRVYGVLEAQFRRYYRDALKRRGVTGAELLILLERRLDNVVYRMGFAPSRPAARQLVNHAHLNINGQPIDVPSYLVKPGDKITVRDVSRKLPYFKELTGNKDGGPTPVWLQADRAALAGIVAALPKREDIDVPLKEQLVVEYYSR